MAARMLNIAVALVWLINGFYCKVLNQVPRHREIVARILGENLASWVTPTIGVLEILMGIWILSRLQTRLCAVAQIVVIATMNALEFFLAPDLLLFGKVNAIVAAFLLVIVYLNGFVLYKPKN
jgi:hypothetical protein